MRCLPKSTSSATLLGVVADAVLFPAAAQAGRLKSAPSSNPYSLGRESAAKMENHASSGNAKDPASFLSSIIGVPVTVQLNSGVVYKGELQSVDGYMNIALEKCQEIVNGQVRRTYGDAFVRGNNVLYISSE
ncbi:hypothetical protein DV737_g1756, partial [Chaetothyriales sp. CBS 132003]